MDLAPVSDVDDREHVEVRDRRSVRTWDIAPFLYAFALAFWACSWNLRLSVLMAWLPVEPVWLGAGAVALCVVHRLGRPLRVAPAVAGPLVLLVLGFLPGVLNSSAEGYAPTKVATLILVVLPVVLAAVVLLDSPEARRSWLRVQVLLGSAVAFGMSVSRSTSPLAPGRYTLTTVDTISTARYTGAAVVVLLLLGLTSWKRALWALPLSAISGVALVYDGSRGPALFAMVAVVLAVGAARWFGWRRLVVVPAVVVLGYLGYRFAVAMGGAGGQRIVASLRSGFLDDTRERLLRSAVHLGLAHPMGVGWGDFAQESPVGHQLANANGVAYPHDVLAEAFSEGGVLALLVLALVVALALLRLWRLSSDPWHAALLASALFWVLNSLVSFDLVGNRFMWITLACGVAAYADPHRGRRRYIGLRSSRAPGAAASATAAPSGSHRSG